MVAFVKFPLRRLLIGAVLFLGILKIWEYTPSGQIARHRRAVNAKIADFGLSVPTDSTELTYSNDYVLGDGVLAASYRLTPRIRDEIKRRISGKATNRLEGWRTLPIAESQLKKNLLERFLRFDINASGFYRLYNRVDFGDRGYFKYTLIVFVDSGDLYVLSEDI